MLYEGKAHEVSIDYIALQCICSQPSYPIPII